MVMKLVYGPFILAASCKPQGESLKLQNIDFTAVRYENQHGKNIRSFKLLLQRKFILQSQ